MRRIAFLSAFLIFMCSISVFNADAKEFTNESEKSLIVFAKKPSPFSVRIDFVGIDTEKQKLKNGFNVVILKGEILPVSSADDTKLVSIKTKKVKPGNYLLTGGNGGTWGKQKSSNGCYAANSRLLSVEAGKAYLFTLPNGRAIKNSEEMDWDLNPQVSEAELKYAFDRYLESNENIAAEVEMVTFKNVVFEPRYKLGGCFPPKDGKFVIK